MTAATDLEKAAARVARAWTDHETSVSVPAMIKAEMQASWPELHSALENLRKHVTGRVLQGDDL